MKLFHYVSHSSQLKVLWSQSESLFHCWKVEYVFTFLFFAELPDPKPADLFIESCNMCTKLQEYTINHIIRIAFRGNFLILQRALPFFYVLTKSVSCITLWINWPIQNRFFWLSSVVNAQKLIDGWPLYCSLSIAKSSGYQHDDCEVPLCPGWIPGCCCCFLGQENSAQWTISTMLLSLMVW